jgi:hypothetical protein
MVKVSGLTVSDSSAQADDGTMQGRHSDLRLLISRHVSTKSIAPYPCRHANFQSSVCGDLPPIIAPKTSSALSQHITTVRANQVEYKGSWEEWKEMQAVSDLAQGFAQHLPAATDQPLKEPGLRRPEPTLKRQMPDLAVQPSSSPDTATQLEDEHYGNLHRRRTRQTRKVWTLLADGVSQFYGHVMATTTMYAEFESKVSKSLEAPPRRVMFADSGPEPGADFEVLRTFSRPLHPHSRRPFFQRNHRERKPPLPTKCKA